MYFILKRLFIVNIRERILSLNVYDSVKDNLWEIFKVKWVCLSI